MNNKKTAAIVAILLAGLCTALAATFFAGKKDAPPPVVAEVSSAAPDVRKLMGGLQDVLAAYRKIIVLFADEKTLSATERELANQVGQGLFHENRARVVELETLFAAVSGSGHPQRFEAMASVLDYVESNADLFDADRLAFRELLRSWQAEVARDSALPAIKLHKRMGEDLEALAEIERNYEKEIRQVFGRFEPRAIELKRERWDDYVASLKKRYTRDLILKDYGVVVPYPAPPKATARKGKSEEEGEVFGTSLPPKTIVLTFDDGPHRSYTAEIAAILKQYGAPAVFFQVGSNLGTLGADGKPKLNNLAAVSRNLLAGGYTIANHSMTHAQLSKRSGEALKTEILGTDEILKTVDASRSPLFRFPYGARNEEGLNVLEGAHLRSVMWNIDSLDWADPVPSSITDRVLQTVAKEGRGIVLFHDIHERTVKALPAILDRLVVEGYQFAGWDGSGFTVAKGRRRLIGCILIGGARRPGHSRDLDSKVQLRARPHRLAHQPRGHAGRHPRGLP